MKIRGVLKFYRRQNFRYYLIITSSSQSVLELIKNFTKDRESEFGKLYIETQPG